MRWNNDYDVCGKNQYVLQKKELTSIFKAITQKRLTRPINLNGMQRKSFDCKQFRNKTD